MIGVNTTLSTIQEIPIEDYFRGIGIVGGKGSGKTTADKVLGENAVIQGVPVIAIDTHGDIAMAIKMRNPDEMTTMEKEQALKFTENGYVVVFGYNSELPSLSLNPLNLIYDTDNLTIISYVARSIINMLEIPTKNIFDYTSILSNVLTNLKKKERRYESLDQLALDLKDLYTGEADRISRMYLVSLRRKLLFFRDDAALNSIMKQGLPFTSKIWTKKYKKKVPFIVIYLANILDDKLKNFIVNMIFFRIYMWMLQDKGQHKLCILLDEAKDYIPSTKNTISKQIILKTNSDGRKYGVATIISTQMPQECDHRIITQQDIWFLGKIKGNSNINALRKSFPDIRVEKLLGLKVGNFYMVNNETKASLVHFRNTTREHPSLDQPLFGEDILSNEMKKKQKIIDFYKEE